MRKLIPTVMVMSLVALSASAVWAADDVADLQRTSVDENAVSPGSLRNEIVGIKPEIAILGFHDSAGQNTTRGAIGLHMDMNWSNLVSGASNRLYFGPSIGALYSHIGGSDANFFGANGNVTSGTSSGNLLEFPLEAKLGYNITDNLRVSAHGGGNVLYRSVQSSMVIDNNLASNSKWQIFPAVGGDLEFGLGKHVSLDFRPDWTLTPTNNLFTGALGIGIALG